MPVNVADNWLHLDLGFRLAMIAPGPAVGRGLLDRTRPAGTPDPSGGTGGWM